MSLAYLINWTAGIFAGRRIPLPADIELIDTNGVTVCRYTVAPNGSFTLQQGALPERGRYRVRFTDAERHQTEETIEFPA